jgi:hypothetical protein
MDQRGLGFPHIVNGTIDIGAFAVQATAGPVNEHIGFRPVPQGFRDQSLLLGREPGRVAGRRLR